MVHFKTIIKKFGSQGEKTGWTYIDISSEIIEKIKPGAKTSFRVKGKLDEHPIKGFALLPMGGGDFIMALNADIRKIIGKKTGYELNVYLTEDRAAFIFNKDFIICVKDEPKAFEYFNSLAASHQRYFSKWIDSAKTTDTQTKRIVLAVKSLSQKMGYGEMIRANKK